MKLKNKFAIGTLIQFYELEMIPDLMKSYVGILKDIENKENVSLHFTFNLQEYLEEIDLTCFENYPNQPKEYVLELIKEKFNQLVGKKELYPANLIIEYKTNNDPFYNIASYRRDLCWNWCEKVDLVIFGETDTMMGSKSLLLLDSLHEMVKDETPKYVANFAGRLNWDSSWLQITHPLFKNVEYRDNDEFIFNNEASEKSYMTYERLEQIDSIPINEVEIIEMIEPKADGAALILSSELLKSGVTLPKSLIHCSEDEAIIQMAKRIMGSEFRQFHFSNYMRCHNRRHPKKRTGVLNENNPNGKCTVEDKGDWWKILEDSSKANFSNLFTQKPFIKMDEVMDRIAKNHPHQSNEELNELNQTYKK